MEMIQKVGGLLGVSGAHVMAYRQEETVADMIDASDVLDGRVPWYPRQNLERKSEFAKRAIR